MYCNLIGFSIVPLVAFKFLQLKKTEINMSGHFPLLYIPRNETIGLRGYKYF